MENCVIPLCNLRGRSLYKRHQQDTENDDNILEGEAIPLKTFLKEEKKKSNFSSSSLGQVSKLCWLREKPLRINSLNVHVVSDTVLMVNFNRKDHKLDLYDVAKDSQTSLITTDEDYFDTDKIVLIGSWGLNLLAYTIPFMNDGEAALVKIDLKTKALCKVQSWDLTVFWTHKHLTSQIELEHLNNNIGFNSSVSHNGKFVLLTGPSETFGSTSVCKIMDADTDELIQVVDLGEYKWTHTTAFHPDNNQVAMICSLTLYGDVPKSVPVNEAIHSQNQLVCYNISSHKIVARSAFKDVSPHLLRFSPDGKLLGVKRYRKGAIAIVCAESLCCLSLIEQEVSLLSNARLITKLIFHIFPLFSKDSRQYTVLQNKRKVCADQSMKTFCWSRGDMWVTRYMVPKVASNAAVKEDHLFDHGSRGKYQKTIHDQLYQTIDFCSQYSDNKSNKLQLDNGNSLVKFDDI